MIEIIIPLPPVPWQAPIKGKYTVYDPKEKEKRAARYYVKSQYNGEVITDYTFLLFHFFFKIPDKTSKKKREEMLSGKIFPTRSDCTNLQKLYEDCLKGIVIDDDRKAVRIYTTKTYAEKERIEIKVFTIEEYTKWKEEYAPKKR